jgi:hypothetical protein
VKTGPGHHFSFTIANDPALKRGEIGFSMYQRRWANFSLAQQVIVNPLTLSVTDPQITSVMVTADFSLKKKYVLFFWRLCK